MEINKVNNIAPPTNATPIQTSAGSPHILYHRHGGSDGPLIPLQNISGYFASVTTTPTFKPSGSAQTAIAVNTNRNQIFYYDFTNKKWRSSLTQPSVDSITTAASYVLDTDTYDSLTITALATSLNTLNTSGSPVDFQKLVIRIKDNGTSQTLAWGTNFVSQGITLPTATVAGKTMTLGFIYNAAESLWGAVAYVHD